MLSLLVPLISIISAERWSTVELHDTGIDEINWKKHLQFYWNTPILTASSDPEMHPFLQDHIFPSLNEVLGVLPPTENRFGDLYNISDVLSLLDDLQYTSKKKEYSSFSELISIYKKRIVSWMALYTRGQCIIDADLNSIYLLVLSPGQMIPLHGYSNFPVLNVEHESHDLISILSIQSQHEAGDGLFIYDPRGTVSGYGFANTFIHTSQSEELNTLGGYIHIFPSSIKFNTLPLDYTRVLLVSFARLYSIHQPYRVNNTEHDVLRVYHLQKETTTYLHSNDAPFFDENIQFLSRFGTPIFESKLGNYKSLSVPRIDLNIDSLDILSKCFIHYGSRSKSVRKSNRNNGWQSTSDIFNVYRDIKWIIAGDHHLEENRKCHDTIPLLYDYLVEQVSLWLLSFSNSYYFDDNGLIIDYNKIYIDIIDSWFNINRGIAMNVPHSHPNSDLSGVMYIDVPKKKGDFDGDIFFEDPRDNLFDNNMHLPFAQFNEPLQIAPQNGDTILFPSWLRHWNMPTYNSKPRVSFAFNVIFRGMDDNEAKTDTIQILKKEL